MSEHKYRVGQRVVYRPSGYGSTAHSATFRIERLLPPEPVENQYRIENVQDGHRRVVREGELRAAAMGES